MQFTRVAFQLVPIFIFIVIYATIFLKVRGSGIQVIKMSLKSNSGTSTSDESTAKEDQVLVRSTSGSRKSNVESKVLVSRTKSANSKHLSDAKETHAVRLVISAPNGAESKNEKGRFNRQFQNIRKGTLSDIRSAVAPSGVQNKMMANREKVDFKLLAISVTIVVVFMTTFLPR